MTAPIDCQIITDAHGQPAFAVIPYAGFMKRYAQSEGLIPHEVISATVDGVPPIKAWREYLRLTQSRNRRAAGHQPIRIRATGDLREPAQIHASTSG